MRKPNEVSRDFCNWREESLENCEYCSDNSKYHKTKDVSDLTLCAYPNKAVALMLSQNQKSNIVYIKRQRSTTIWLFIGQFGWLLDGNIYREIFARISSLNVNVILNNLSNNVMVGTFLPEQGLQRGSWEGWHHVSWQISATPCSFL